MTFDSRKLGSTKYYLLGVGKSSICLGLWKGPGGEADVQGSKKWQDTEDIYSAKFVLTLRDSVRDTTLNMRPTIYYKIHTVQDLLLLQMLKS